MQRKHKSDFHTHRGTQHITTSSHWLCITPWEGGGAQCWYFCLSWVWASLSWLGPCWQLCTMQCTAALYTCTVIRPLLSPLSDWDSDTLGQPPLASSDPHTQTTTQMIETRDSRQLQIKSHRESWCWSKYLHFHWDSLHQAAATPCCLPNISQESVELLVCK